jgi:hypothetical protein
MYIKLPMYLALGLLILMWENPLLWPLEGVGPENHDFFVPKCHSLCLLLFQGPKVLIFLTHLGLAISNKKNYSCGRRNRRHNWFVPAEFRLFRGTENSRNSVLNRYTEEKNARNSVPWNKNRRKLTEFLSEPFRGTEYS